MYFPLGFERRFLAAAEKRSVLRHGMGTLHDFDVPRLQEATPRGLAASENVELKFALTSLAVFLMQKTACNQLRAGALTPSTVGHQIMFMAHSCVGAVKQSAQRPAGRRLVELLRMAGKPGVITRRLGLPPEEDFHGRPWLSRKF